MSWQPYIDEHLMAIATDEKGNQFNLTSAAICGQDGGVWASSTEFPAITAEEVAVLAKRFDGDAAPIPSFTIGGVKYQAVMADPDSKLIRGALNKGGCHIKLTNTALVIGIWDDAKNSRHAEKVVLNIGKYLMGINF